MNLRAWTEEGGPGDRQYGATIRIAKEVEPATWVVASLNLAVGDWAVYYGRFDPEEVGRTGDKVEPEEAARFFPQFAKGFRYRR
jgi:hypothetical protein